MGLQTCPHCNQGQLYVYETEAATEKYCMYCSFEERIKHAALRRIKREPIITSPKRWNQT